MTATTLPMHGRNHCPGGSDPIPCLEPATTSFPDLILELATDNELLGYWRLGEGASPYADTSGHSAGPADATVHTGTNPMSPDLTGALPTSQDDGAVEFNHLTDGDYLQSTDPSAPPFRFNFSSNEPFTVAAWIKPAAGTTTYPATAVGSYQYSTTEFGWRIGLNYPALTPFFQRRGDGIPNNVIVTGPALTAGEWVFLVGTYDPTDGHNLYVDGALADSDSSVFSGSVANTQGVFFGMGQTPFAGDNRFLGGIDEVTVWGEALPADEIAQLAAAGS